jgi:hypothetical protein
MPVSPRVNNIIDIAAVVLSGLATVGLILRKASGADVSWWVLISMPIVFLTSIVRIAQRRRPAP